MNLLHRAAARICIYTALRKNAAVAVMPRRFFRGTVRPQRIHSRKSSRRGTSVGKRRDFAGPLHQAGPGHCPAAAQSDSIRLPDTGFPAAVRKTGSPRIAQTVATNRHPVPDERDGPSAQRHALWRSGRPSRARRSLCATYEQLRRLASAVRRDHPGATLTPTALVNEAWLKMANSPHLASVPRLHFKRIAARAMRQVLIEAARRRHASKRGGRESRPEVTFDESLESRDSTRARACSRSTRPSRTWRGFTLARRTSSRPASSAASASAKHRNCSRSPRRRSCATGESPEPGSRASCAGIADGCGGSSWWTVSAEVVPRK